MLFVDRRHDKSSAMNTVGRRSALLSLLHAAGLVAWAGPGVGCRLGWHSLLRMKKVLFGW